MNCFLFCSLCSSCVQGQPPAPQNYSKHEELSRSAPSVQLHCHCIRAVMVYYRSRQTVSGGPGPACHLVW